jgi:hypothetical protein
MLDWYFDYDKTMTLETLMTTAELPQRLTRRIGEPAPDEKKKNRFSGANQVLRLRFQVLLQDFHRKICKLQVEGNVSQAAALPELAGTCIWCEGDEFSVISGQKPGLNGAWLGLGEYRGGFRRPVAIKQDPYDPEDSEGRERFMAVMNLLNPSGYIASATRANVFHCAAKKSASAQVQASQDDSPRDDAFSPRRQPVTLPAAAPPTARIGCVLCTDVKGRVIIDQVKPGGGAAASGNVRTGDILQKVDGTEVTNEAQARDLIIGRGGTSLEVTLQRKEPGHIGMQNVTVTITRLQRLYRRWVFEVGICTLDELFHDPISDEERRTQAFRALLREVSLTHFNCIF